MIWFLGSDEIDQYDAIILHPESKSFSFFSKQYSLKEYEDDIISSMFYELESPNNSKFSKLLPFYNYLCDAINGIFRTLKPSTKSDDRATTAIVYLFFNH